MHAAYVLEEYPELSQTFVESEMREHKRAGHKVDVFALRPGDAAGLAKPDFVPLYPPKEAARLLAATAVTLKNPGILKRDSDWPSDGHRARGIARIAPWSIRARRVDHLHAHFASEAADIAALLSRMTGVPYSFTGHSTDLFDNPAATARRVRAAKFTAVVCEYDRREVEKFSADGRIEVVPVGLDLAEYERTTAYDPDGPVVAVGRLVEQKGFADLAAVAKDLGREVIIAGQGPLQEDLERKPVTLLGPLDPPRAARLIESASVLVAPSVVGRTGDRDGIPTVLKEALALGVPIVASDCVGNPEVVEPEHGVLYPPGDRRALKHAITGLLARDDREAMGRAGRAWAEQHADVKKTAEKLRGLWAEPVSASAAYPRAAE